MLNYTSFYTCTYVCTVDTITRKVLQVLLPIMNDIRDDMTSLKENMIYLSEDFNFVKEELTSLNETVSYLSGDLEQHTNQTASVLADIHVVDSKLISGMTNELSQFSTKLGKLDSSVNASVSEAFNFSVSQVSEMIHPLNSKLVSVDTTVESMRGDLRFVKEKLSHLSSDLEQHKNQTTSVLADLQSLDFKVTAINTSMTEEITYLENQLNAKLDVHTASITADLQSFINMSHTELLSLIQSLK